MYVISRDIKINILQDAGLLKKFFPVSSTPLYRLDDQRIEALDNYDEEMLDKREYRGMDQSTAAPTTQNTHAPTHPTAESQRQILPPWLEVSIATV